MQLRKLLHDDDAVSPVIGVILMVAITVILAAVIASFVLGLGGEQTVAPQVSFSFDYEDGESPIDSSNDAGNLTISHDGGDTISAPEFVIRGDGIIDVGNNDYSGGATINSPNTVDEVRFDATEGTWAASTTTGEPLVSNQASEMSSGQNIVVGVTRSYDIDIVWDPEDADDSSVLGSDEGPDA